MSVSRVYVEKKQAFAVEASHLLHDLTLALSLPKNLTLRLLHRYDIEGLPSAFLPIVIEQVLSEPAVDHTYLELPPATQDTHIIAIESLPGQYDQRADSAAQCISLITKQAPPLVRCANIILITGPLSAEQRQAVEHDLINPVECRAASLDLPDTLALTTPPPEPIERLTGFCVASQDALLAYQSDFGLSMDLADLLCCQAYFRGQDRNPTLTELRCIDTYWSDHCRHTTFLTHLQTVTIHDPAVQAAYDHYLATRADLYGENPNARPQTLMDLGTIAARACKKSGALTALDESEEINACSVNIDVTIEPDDLHVGKSTTEPWLLMFKNETHNHPTEIEPFGGAATCLGGAIRDPLSGRAYVYQAMRVTGAADPRTPTADTLKGKLPQHKITVGAANGYSSYGNQIGIATGQVSELYHPGYAAKRLELGAVVAAAPKHHVVRETPEPSDVVMLLGGKTGRDGCGGATGSSKAHTDQSALTCGAEVQKGNPVEERKLQRLFRNPEVTRLIRRCNDFGAGGVCVAIGELADGVTIFLDEIPKKYEGLSGTELAISESQERMACVVRKQDVDFFITLAEEENLLATPVATITDDNKLRMIWRGEEIVCLDRSFLDTNGAEKRADVEVPLQTTSPLTHPFYPATAAGFRAHLSSLSCCSTRGLAERFDSTIGAGTVLLPFGGSRQRTPAPAMVAKIPILKGETSTCSVMGWGFDPHISEQAPFLGGMYAVIESIAKVVSVGGSPRACWLSFQEYFERPDGDPKRLGKPFAALLGAYQAQLSLGIAAIGGKDSMSGSFSTLWDDTDPSPPTRIDVPPTLVSFAVSVTDAAKVVSNDFKGAGNPVALILPDYEANGIPNFNSIKTTFALLEQLIATHQVKSCQPLGSGGISQAIFLMSLGNQIGFKFAHEIPDSLLWGPCYGGFVVELSGAYMVSQNLNVIGVTTSKNVFVLPNNQMLDLGPLEQAYEATLEPIFPTKKSEQKQNKTATPHRTRSETISYQGAVGVSHAQIAVAKPRVLIPVFPGTNCEYDAERAFTRAGAIVTLFVVKNQTVSQIKQSADEFNRLLRQTQIVMIPGGFSGGDEPDGAGKFITAFFRNPRITDSVHQLLLVRDGLMLGICNGFQALLKLGLVPYGEIVPMKACSPTLTFNDIGRHQSRMVQTRIASTKSPWLSRVQVGEEHIIAISHGEGRFVAEQNLIQKMQANGQIATQYVDLLGEASLAIDANPNGSAYAIEGITSPDGRVFGKMGHSERIGNHLYKNVPGEKDQHLFEAGVSYFKG